MTTEDPIPHTAPTAGGLQSEDFDALDAILDDLRSREDEVPQWEFCEGFLAAVICCREPIGDQEALDALLPEFADEAPLFASDAQRAEFLALWVRRRAELAHSLSVRVISLCPGVVECAAVGVPDAKSGETIKVFIVKEDPTLTEEQVAAYCHDNLTGYKRPKYIEFRDELPKTNVGKILRRELRSKA